MSLPQPNGPVAAATGEIWCFPCWFRDGGGTGGMPTSNFSDGLAIQMN